MSSPKANYDAYVQDVRSKKLAEMQQVVPRVREIYDSGTPFFTKEAIRKVIQQIDDIETGQPGVISVIGIDGNIVQLRVKTGEIDSDIEPGVEMTYLKAHLDYWTVDHLTVINDPLSFRAKFAYLPLRIAYITEYRNSITKTPIPMVPLLPLEEVQENFEQKRAEWEASKQCDELKSVLGSIAAEIPPIQKIVAFACSSMTWDDAGSHRSAVQHAFILTIRDFLAKRGSAREFNINCYAQDPLYTTVDKQVLQKAGITILDDPRGFLEIDGTTAVFSQAPDIPVRQITADITKPAMMIWNKVVDQIEPPPQAQGNIAARSIGVWADPVSPRLHKMVKDYVEIPFLRDSVNFCEDTCIYIRKTGYSNVDDVDDELVAGASTLHSSS
ncbi:hypothetical protein GGR51DRAFT_29692 [Nemania sp. FL0031]|nr:hypothetical protein GGR51DRAFT_29692 [Nemania sp. FL0031]